MNKSLLLALLLFSLVALGGLIAGGVLLSQPKPIPQALFSSVCDAWSLLDGAREHDPFACSRGLLVVKNHPEETQLAKKYIAACCNPPVKDMAGIVERVCKVLYVQQMPNDAQ